MCWVMPPASPKATRVRRIWSSNEVLPWSTWPMTVTTGARGSCGASLCSAFSRKTSGSLSLAANARCPNSSTTIIAVSWSSTWLMVTIDPIFIRVLITSVALTAILCASSATEMVSGTCTSCTTASVGAWKACADSDSALPRPPRLPCRPSRHSLPVVTPRVLIPWRLPFSSPFLAPFFSPPLFSPPVISRPVFSAPCFSPFFSPDPLPSDRRTVLSGFSPFSSGLPLAVLAAACFAASAARAAIAFSSASFFRRTRSAARCCFSMISAS